MIYLEFPLYLDFDLCIWRFVLFLSFSQTYIKLQNWSSDIVELFVLMANWQNVLIGSKWQILLFRNFIILLIIPSTI